MKKFGLGNKPQRNPQLRQNNGFSILKNMVNVMIEETIFGNQIVHIFWKVNFVERKRFEAGKKFAEKILREKVFYPKLRTLTYCENPPTPPTFIYLYVPTSTLTSIARFNCVHFSNLDVQGYVILTIIERPDVLSIERPKTNVRKWTYFGPYNIGGNIGENKHPLRVSNLSSLES